ncbi:DUF4190 domain-containing protein [Kitasatospora viridis]|uniref:Putative regulator of septum formation n=1 Tax=Kitasatospora viridis TaxID=281105 RepID=A0A561UMY8_9ACTN|nr:DUF4190 domain-containing protein [Kitasatospora viridis]TWG00736.1 putative regulator of septum formation [Kitasatospora viridis]
MTDSTGTPRDEEPEHAPAQDVPVQDVPVQDVPVQDVPVQDGTPQDAALWDVTPPAGGAPNPYATPPAAPYGSPYPSSPYPGAPGFGHPAPSRTNGLAIGSLVTGIICCLWPVAIGLGVGALSQLGKPRHQHERGRGLAVAGLVLGTIGLLCTVVVMATGGFHFYVRTGSGAPGPSAPGLSAPGGPSAAAPAAGPSGVFAWKPGTCFNEATGDSGAARTPVDCAQPHYGEVFSTAPLAGGSGYPGLRDTYRQASLDCSTTEHTYVTDPWARDVLGGSYQIRFLYPDSPATWDRSGHLAVCFLHRASGPGKGSVRLDGTTLTQDQQNLLTVLSHLELRQKALAIQVTDPAQASATAQGIADGIGGALTAIGSTQWSGAAKDGIAALTSTLQADQPVWTAAADNTDDPVGAYRQAVRADNPLVAETAARTAFSLTDHDTATAPDPAVPDLPGDGSGSGGGSGDGGGSGGGGASGGASSAPAPGSV